MSTTTTEKPGKPGKPQPPTLQVVPELLPHTEAADTSTPVKRTRHTVIAITIRLLPSPPTDATTFQSYLQDLTITAYDQSILPVDPSITTPGVTEYSLGSASVSASSPLWTPLQSPPFLVDVTPASDPNGIPTLASSVFQHFYFDPFTPATILKSVATAVILVNIDPKAPSPYPQYPDPKSYDVRLTMQRGNPPVLLPQAPIEWNINTVTVSYFTPPLTPQWDVVQFILEDPNSVSMYVLLQNPPPPKAPASSTINLSSDGTAPKFDDLVQAVNPVLATYNLGAHSLDKLSNPLTADQAGNIATQIMFNPALQRLPLPVPPYPSDTASQANVSYLEDLYTAPASGADNIRKQFEGALQAYHANNNSAAQKLAPFIFAASAAVYAEMQTTKAQSASWTLPLFEGNGTSTTSATVTLSGSDAPLNPSFVVPAAYFYALTANSPATSDAKLRYQTVLEMTADSMVKKLQAAQASGIVSNSEVPLTVAGATSVTDISAVLRLTALNAPNASGSGPVLELKGSVATLVSGWLNNPPTTVTGQSPFWTTGSPPEFESKDYLHVILQIVTKDPYPSKFITEILKTPLVPVPKSAPRKIKTASDLPLITNASWLSLFQSLFSIKPRILPTWVEPGSVQQQTQAFITWIQTLFSVGFEAANPLTASTGNVASLGTDFSSDVLGHFFSEYSGFTFAVDLDDSKISAVLSTPAFSDVSLQRWIRKALTTIRALYVMTAITSPAIPTLQFSYMEALYARGFTTLESVATLTLDQFTSALTGTVAYYAAGQIYKLATASPMSIPPTQSEPGYGFQPCNPGDLVNCIPPPNLSPFSKIEYLHELLQLSSGTSQLAVAISTRRGPIGTLKASLANLFTEINVVDLINESLEALGSVTANKYGAVYSTAESSLAGFDFGKGPTTLPADKVLAAIPQYSSPSISISESAIYDTLKVCFTSPCLPYSQKLDVNRSYLCHIGSTRFDIMRHFRQDITEFPMGTLQEPPGFDKSQWRFPVCLDLALEYLQISMDEYTALWSATPTPSLIAQLYGIDISTNQESISSLTSVSSFLNSTGLAYCEFLDLWRSGFVNFRSESKDSGFPECPPCCLESLKFEFPDKPVEILLAELILFIRLWQKLQLRCQNKISMKCLADICTVLSLFANNNGLHINPDFILQLASLLMLVDVLKLPWSYGTASATETGVQRTKLLAIWAGPSSDPTAWSWALNTLLLGIENYAQHRFECFKRGPEFAGVLSENLDELSSLAGFTPEQNPWHSTPTCTIRFAEILAKIYASNFTVGELVFLFTTKRHLDGDDPFRLDDDAESLIKPLDLPDDSPYGLVSLRKDLLCVDISQEDIQNWDWYRVESAIREAGFSVSPAKDSSDPLIYLAQHFFPDVLEQHGYRIEAEKRRFTASLQPSSTSPPMWSSPPCEPFHYVYELDASLSNTNADKKAEQLGDLWTQLPLRDGAVINQLRALRQLNAAEIQAVQNLYFAPRLALAPFASIFSNFSQAVHFLIEEPSEEARFEFFKWEVARFHRRCEIIADHLSDHVRSASCFDNKQKDGPGRDLAWKVLTSLMADENTPTSAWENDSGLPPTQFEFDPHFSGSALAAILGLVGTGLEGRYETSSGTRWMEMRGGLSAFGYADNEWNIPIPTILPSLDLTPSSGPNEVITYKNGMILGDEDGRELGGAQPFSCVWTGSLIIEQAGDYCFGAGHPTSERDMPEGCSEHSWLVTLGRGQKTWVILNNNSKGTEAPAHISSPVLLEKGVYTLTVKFDQHVHLEPQGVELCRCQHIRTGFELKYEGPDTEDRPIEVPYSRLMRNSKSGPFSLDVGGAASQYLRLQYGSTFRDIRRTYQRVFKATLFSHRFNLSARKMDSDNQSELGYILSASEKFAGTSFYIPSGSSSFQSHHASFDFNFLPVSDPYLSPDVAVDSRVSPSLQRQAAMFDWFERIFDYTWLRKNIERVRKRPIWLLFQDASTQKPAEVGQYVRYIGIELELSSLALQYFANPLYQVTSTDLMDERWATRMWHVREWLCSLSKKFYSELLQQARPALWATDDPNALIGGSSGNGNLTYFVQHTLLSSKSSQHSFKTLTALNDGLRLRARDALLAYLCGMNRVPITLGGVSTFATKPHDLSDLLLQDVEARITEKSSRIDDAILSVQTFVQRALIGLEPSFTLTHKFSMLWKDRFSTFDDWVASKRRAVYKENWVHWDELEKLRSFKGPKFLIEELKQLTSTIPEPGRPMWWAGDNFPPESIIDPIQVREIATFGLEQGSTSTFEGLSLIGTPQRDARPSLLAAGLVFTSASTATSDSNPTTTTSVAKRVLVSKNVDATGLGTLESIPLWIQAAIRLGTQFVRVAAAGVPPAFRYKSSKSEGSVCCSECGLLHDDVIDEYYFWLQDSTYFDNNDAEQNADIGSSSAIDPTTDWENVSDPTKNLLSTLIYWPPKPLLHLQWTRVHMGRLDPPRRSDEGISYDPTSAAPLLAFTGRQIDSLNFAAFDPNFKGSGSGSGSSSSPTFTGFRYDIATDTAIVVPQPVGDALPPLTQPKPLAAFPVFAYFEPGKPLVPVSSFGVGLAMASVSRANCRFESSLKWCQLLFDPLSRDNTWPQCPKNSVNTSVVTEAQIGVVGSGPESTSMSSESSTTSQPTAVKATEDVKATEATSISPAQAHVTRSDLLNPPSTKQAMPTMESSTTTGSKAILTPATTPGEVDMGKQLELEGTVGRDLPCCPSSPVTQPIARSRAVLLEFLKTLLQWGDRLLHDQSIEASHKALVIFNTMDRILGPRPTTVNAHDTGTSSMTVSNFVASPASLNPELLRLYDIVIDRRNMIREDEDRRRLRIRLDQISLTTKPWDPFQDSPACGITSCFSRCQPYRFTSLLPKALDTMSMVKELGSALLSAYEKGDSEYLEAIRSAQDRKILDLSLRTAQNAWRASDWDVQALDESMQSALTRLRYYQGLIQNGLNSGETGYQSSSENAMQAQTASNVAESTSEAANIIPDLAFGVAGLGPYESTTIPIGTKLANFAATAARIMSMIAQISNSNGGLQLTQAGWDRRAQDWQNQVNVIQFEIQQIKRQTLAAWRRRDSALHDLNSHQQQMDHSAEVQDFMRDKLTKHELYLFLQQETAALYRQAYTLAVQTARDAEEAFRFERGDMERNFLANLDWDNLHEGLMAGDRLGMALRSMDRAYMETNCREYELTKHLSAKFQFPKAFLKLKCCGYCEVDIPEWTFDLDYPGHYMRRIKSMTLSIACVAGPYTSINCRLQLLSSAVRLKPLLPAEEACCCTDKHDDCCDHDGDPYLARHYGATEAIATSNGQDDSGLFQLDFKDERYLPFEFKGAVSRWRIELPSENNQFDIASLTDVVMHINYTSREGGHQLRKKANEYAQRHLPGDGVRFFSIRHDFPDTWRIFQMENCKEKHRDWPLRFNRSMFPFLTGRRAVRIKCIHLFVETAHACPGSHIRVSVIPSGEKGQCREREFVCIVDEDCAFYFGKVEVEFGPIVGNAWHNFGHLRFDCDMPRAEEAYLLCEYEVDCVEKDCKCTKCCAPDLGSWPPRLGV